MQKVKTINAVNLVNGPVCFGDDWPGVFLTPKYIHEKLGNVYDMKELALKHSSQPVLGNLGFPGFAMENSILYQWETTLPFREEGTLVVSKEILNAPNFVSENNYSRMETGLVKINNQVGFFIRGDNTLYISGGIPDTMLEEFHPFLKEYVEILKSCMLKGAFKI